MDQQYHSVTVTIMESSYTSSAPRIPKKRKLSVLSLDSGCEENSKTRRDRGRLGKSLTADDYMDDDELPAFLASLSFRRDLPALASNTIPSKGLIRIPSYQQNGVTYKEGCSAELKSRKFLRVVSLWTDSQGCCFLQGKLLKRLTDEADYLPNKCNELVWLNLVNEEDFHNGVTEATLQFPVTDALRNRHVVFTNQRYPACSVLNSEDKFLPASERRDSGSLFCRWKHIKVKGNNIRKHEETLMMITCDDADEKGRVDADTLRSSWRKPEFQAQAGGSFVSEVQRDVINLEEDRAEIIFEDEQKYAFGDAFCGGGGVTRGAVQAGLYPKWGFDADEAAITAYKINFGELGTECLHQSVDVFATLPETKNHYVDVLHISPPCQPYSKACTVPNWHKNEINTACTFSILHLIQRTKPRVVTIEEADNLVNGHVVYFNGLLAQFVDLGYSIKWKILSFEQYGVAQFRKRLIVLAAAPGEKLPDFPKSTHGQCAPGLLPLRTIRDCLNVPEEATHHDVGPRIYATGPKLPFSAKKLAPTLTTGGGAGNYHPSGTRGYTARECAGIQGFPTCHEFGPACYTTVRRIIGNAVPPPVAKAIYEEVIKSLRTTDRLGIRNRRPGAM